MPSRGRWCSSGPSRVIWPILVAVASRAQRIRYGNHVALRDAGAAVLILEPLVPMPLTGLVVKVEAEGSHVAAAMDVTSGRLLR